MASKAVSNVKTIARACASIRYNEKPLPDHLIPPVEIFCNNFNKMTKRKDLQYKARGDPHNPDSKGTCVTVDVTKASKNSHYTRALIFENRVIVGTRNSWPWSPLRFKTRLRGRKEPTVAGPARRRRREESTSEEPPA